MNVVFRIDPSRCTECRRCMIACSIVTSGKAGYKKSRISVSSFWPEEPKIDVCRFDDCEGHPCVEICPVDAIEEKEGYVLIDSEACTGCGLCMEACPYGAIRLGENKAWKCDFCGGDPACVKECTTEAIKGDF